MRYLSLAEALVIAETVTGIDTTVLAKAAGVGLLDSALHAPQASYSGQEFYPDFVDKAAVLVVRIARNHPLPDGNKRLAWACLTLFCRAQRPKPPRPRRRRRRPDARRRRRRDQRSGHGRVDLRPTRPGRLTECRQGRSHRDRPLKLVSTQAAASRRPCGAPP